MAVTTSKVTYSLKPSTVDRVQELSVAWGVPKSEVIRRAVEQVSDGTESSRVKVETPLEVLERIQREGTGLSRNEATKFKAEIRRERNAWGQKKK